MNFPTASPLPGHATAAPHIQLHCGALPTRPCTNYYHKHKPKSRVTTADPLRLRHEHLVSTAVLGTLDRLQREPARPCWHLGSKNNSSCQPWTTSSPRGGGLKKFARIFFRTPPPPLRGYPPKKKLAPDVGIFFRQEEFFTVCYLNLHVTFTLAHCMYDIGT